MKILILLLSATPLIASDYISVEEQNEEMHRAFQRSSYKKPRKSIQIDKTCPFSHQDITRLQNIIDEGISYIQAAQKNMYDPNSPLAQVIKGAFDREKFNKYLDLETFTSLGQGMVCDEFLTYLEFFKNTVSYNLIDDKYRNESYQNLKFEVHVAFNWFKLQNVDSLRELANPCPVALFFMTIYSIFSEITTYFPYEFNSIDENDSSRNTAKLHITNIADRCEEITIGLAKYVSSNITRNVSKESRLRVLKSLKENLEKDRKSLVAPIYLNDLWNNENGDFGRDVLKAIHKEEFKQKPKKLKKPIIKKDELLSTFAIETESTPELEKVNSAPEIIIDEIIQDTSETIEPEKNEETYVSSITPSSEEESFDEIYENPSDAHKRYQEIKGKKEQASECDDLIESGTHHNSLTPEFSVFEPNLIFSIHDCIYGKEKSNLTWDGFKEIFSPKNGFTIVTRKTGQKGHGSARKVTFSDGRQFTIHEPDTANTPIPFD